MARQPQGSEDPKARRARQLAEALRANLKRRKAQQRERSASPAALGEPDPDGE